MEETEGNDKYVNFVVFFLFLYNNAGNMSVKKWHQLAEEKSKLDKQTEEIHQKFKMDKINKEFSQLSGEELFKPITKRLDEKSSTTAEEEEEEEEEEEQEGPDYRMDEFERTNPLVMNSDRMHQHQHHRHQQHQQHQHPQYPKLQHHHPHIKNSMIYYLHL